MGPDGISLTRDEGITILGSLDDAYPYVVATDQLTVVLELEDAQAILVGRLFGDPS